MQLIAWLDRHAAPIALALLILTLIARAVAAIYGPTHPRLRAAVEALGALSPDPVRTIAQVYEALTGRQLAPLWLLLGDVLLRPEAAPSSPSADDPGARATVVPGDRPPDETTRSMRRPGAGTLGAMCLAVLAVGAPLGCATTSASAGHPSAEARAAATASTALVSAALVRRIVCAVPAADSPALSDPAGPAAVARRYLCDPMVGALLEVAPLLVPRSSGADAPSSPAAPPPVPLPAAPPPAAPRVEEDAGGVPGDAAAPAGTDGRL